GGGLGLLDQRQVLVVGRVAAEERGGVSRPPAARQRDPAIRRTVSSLPLRNATTDRPQRKCESLHHGQGSRYVLAQGLGLLDQRQAGLGLLDQRRAGCVSEELRRVELVDRDDPD